MNEEGNKEIIKFILGSIEKISLVILQTDYEVEEMEEMNNEAQIYLNDIKGGQK